MKKKRILGIMTHDEGEGSNVRLVLKALLKEQEGYTFSIITKGDTMDVKGFTDLRKVVSFFLAKPYQLARAQVILLDNVFLPFAFLRRRKGAKVIQLWHGTGTIKKFGQDFNTGKLKQLEYRANQNITHLIVNSMETKKLYAKTFGVNENKVYPIGLPKTDDLLIRVKQAERDGINPDKEMIYRKYGLSKGSKLVLYAPTFRDAELENPQVLNKLSDIIDNLPKDYYLGLRLHPFIARVSEKTKLPDRVIQLSFESDLTGLLVASDYLISDYSSIVFEYCVTERPMVFFAYDLEEFSDHGRGFYYNYESYVPGPVTRTGEETAGVIREDEFDIDRIREFMKRTFTDLDGRATKRLLDLIKSE